MGSVGGRREKSLGELCKRFVLLYGSESDCLISLDWTTAHLGVERRRIYDIINILECFEVVSRLGKNTYRWNGLQRIPTTLEKLRQQQSVPPCRRDKSLGLLCLNFLFLFLHGKPALSLKQAAEKLASGSDEQQVKTRVRRLYDISNILVFFKLTEKRWMGTKTVYVWRGSDGFRDFSLSYSKCADQQVWAPNCCVSTPCFDKLMYSLISSLKSAQRAPLAIVENS